MSLHNVQFFSFSISSLTNGSPVTGSLAIYKQNMNKAKENTQHQSLTKTGMNLSKMTWSKMLG